MRSFTDMGLPNEQKDKKGDFKGKGDVEDKTSRSDLNTLKGQNEAVQALLPKENLSVVAKSRRQIDAQNNSRFWLCIYARDEEALEEWLDKHGLGEWKGQRYVPLTEEDAV